MGSPKIWSCFLKYALVRLMLVTEAASSVLSQQTRSGILPRDESQNNSTQSMVYSWDEIAPSPDIQWAPCFDNFTCTRLVVPLDYETPEIGSTVLAYMKFAAEEETPDTPNIQINAGGPGISGTHYLLGSYAMLRDKFGPQYNIIAFDPRGINNSGPSFDCFPGDAETKAQFDQEFTRIIDYKDAGSVRDFYHYADGIGAYCADVHRGGPARYANTVAVAADLVNFAEKQAIANGQNPEEAQIWYQGGSYGSVLGMVFVALYPDRVGRVLIDSIVDTDEYFAGRWINLVADGPKAMKHFFEVCHEIGEKKCAFWAGSPEAIEERTLKALEALRRDPIPFSSRLLGQYPTLITYEKWAMFIALTIMSEVQYPTIAYVLLLLESRAPNPYLADPKNTLYGGIGLDAEATSFISCLDGAGKLDLSTVEKWEEYVQETADTVGPWIVDDWAVLAGMCSKSRDIYPPPHQKVNGTLSANSTRSPVLFMSNTIDAATSITGARKKQQDFQGSGFLEQNAAAHGVVALASPCTKEWIQKYLADATLPPENTVCETEDEIPWDDPSINPFIVGK